MSKASIYLQHQTTAGVQQNIKNAYYKGLEPSSLQGFDLWLQHCSFAVVNVAASFVFLPPFTGRRVIMGSGSRKG